MVRSTGKTVSFLSKMFMISDNDDRGSNRFYRWFE